MPAECHGNHLTGGEAHRRVRDELFKSPAQKKKKKGVLQAMGMINFLCKFIPNLNNQYAGQLYN